MSCVFFFQAEDGIRDSSVTGVQTCALPISRVAWPHTTPRPPAAVAAYVATRLVPIGDGRALLYVAGQVSAANGQRLTGRCPDEVSVEEAQARARVCALNVLAQIESAAGLDKVDQLAQVIGFVLSPDGFLDQPKPINRASAPLPEGLRA